MVMDNNISRKLPIGIQIFENIRREGYLYVDKTAFVWRMASTGKLYFLSRPRRFGKSLLLSTFEAYFEGKKALFEGLAIARLEREWNVYPVLHFEFKLNGIAEEALQQIDDKKYLIPYQVDEREIVKVGVEFSATERNIGKWIY